MSDVDRITVIGSTVYADAYPVAVLTALAPATVADAFARCLAKDATSRTYSAERHIPDNTGT
jgi:hypothetical protein